MDLDLERPEHAYLFGFLLGDGTLTRDRGSKGRLSVELHEQDAAHLEALAALLPGARVSTRTRTTNFSRGPYTTATLTCCLMRVREAFVEAGLPEGRKDRIAAPPKGPYVARDFARGVVDADGSLGFTATGLPFVSLVTNSSALADWWCEVIAEHAGVSRNWTLNARDGAANVMVAGSPAVPLSRWLYRTGDLALARKAARAADMATWERPAEMRAASRPRRWTPEEDDAIRAGGCSQAALGERLNRTVASINARTWRLRHEDEAGLD